MLIGLLRKYNKPMVKDDVAAMFAKELCAETVFFNPDQIDFKNKLIYGQKYKHSTWVEDVTYFPNVVYNDIPLRKDEQVYRQLENQGIPFTTHRLGKNKLEFMKGISNNDTLKSHIIPTVPYQSMDDLTVMLDHYEYVFLKPNRGHKGLGITTFVKDGDYIQVTNATGLNKKISQQELPALLTTIKDLEHHHLQPGINSVTPQGNPFVIRSYVGRNGNGKWLVFFHYAGVGMTNSKIVNVSVGSSFSYILPFLNSIYGDKAKEIKIQLDKLAIQVAQQTQRLVKPKIDALGLDLAINEQGEIYIIEINAFPGTRPFEALVERQAIPYALFLAKNG
ncbi:YheC/YheD family protein [Gracilibacillus alcaliphilus]|uniref:YheC/YheD family protein n=1 Tax=Gracilibacillus alcaliphilus TaxID=1401441 RepID=UPI00308410AE